MKTVTESQTRELGSMKDVAARLMRVLAIVSLALPGCMTLHWQDRFHADGDTEHFKYVATQIEYADVDSSPNLDLVSTAEPRSIDADQPTEYWDITLEEVVRHALANSKVMRDLGGVVIRTPSQAPTTIDPSIQETDPQVGVAAALSAFDASFASNAFFEYNDRALNNTFFGGGTRNLKQDLAIMQTQIAKRSVTGTEFTLRNNTDYDANNSPGNAFNSAWNTNMEAEIRQPLLLGSGVDFNRIAGSSNVPGVYNGVLIARLNVDQNLSDFEMAVRDYVSNLENAYWDLYYAYRDLEAKIKARDSALKTWQVIKALENRRGGEAEKETQAREQYYRFKEEVENALNGRLVQGTQTNNGSRAGTFRGSLGVFVAERRLRLLMGLPINDHRLLRTKDEPPLAEIVLDWDESLLEGLTRRAELRKQKWVVKQRELELQASRRYLLPTLDVVGRYRWRGFGKDLFRQHNLNAADFADTTRKRSESNNAFDSMVNGDFQEWQMGVELAFPFGRRQAHAGVRNAELRLARARVMLKEQERDVVFGLSNTVSDMKRAYAVVQTNFRRQLAAQQQVEAVQLAYDNESTTIDVLLEAQRRQATADSAYYRALADYAVAIKNVHFEKGSLLEFSEVQLSEGLWPIRAYWDAKKRHHLQSKPLKILNPILSARPVVSEGEFPQSVLPADGGMEWVNPAEDGGQFDGGEIDDAEMQKNEAPPIPPTPDLPPSPDADVQPIDQSTPSTIKPIAYEADRTTELKPERETTPSDIVENVPDSRGFRSFDLQSGNAEQSNTDSISNDDTPMFRRPKELRDLSGQKNSQQDPPSVGDDIPFRTPAELKELGP